ncbi:phage tail protein [Pseudomonas sp. zfem003]|uniref:phage tail protein n=1 Tax=Pseudomonas sp. zfem003 TaxID=3078198 RepID=UPI002927639F|nr:phage tail protein [Pseudomonas sp. zfem003]MDU9398022.1 phage tail protein [Pseudomonas sp. zfem003]
MSSGGQIAGGIIGAVVGFYVGGPAGALYGASLGMGVGGYLDPPKGPTVQGPRLNDLSVQTSTYGAIVPNLYGVISVSPNLLWLEKNSLKEIVKKKKQGGKGGGSSSTLKTYTYSATFAIGLCDGPIGGVLRIWCGDRLIYNAGSSDLNTIIASNKVARGMRIYLGTDDQLPDTRYEADVGVGNAPAFRGLAYIVFDDFLLTDYGNTLQAAQFKVEVMQVSERGDAVKKFQKNVSDSNFGNGFYNNAVQPYLDSEISAYCLAVKSSSEVYEYRVLNNGSIIGPSPYINIETPLTSIYSSNGITTSHRENGAVWLGPFTGGGRSFWSRQGYIKIPSGIFSQLNGFLFESPDNIYYCNGSGQISLAQYISPSGLFDDDIFDVEAMSACIAVDGLIYGASGDIPYNRLFVYEGVKPFNQISVVSMHPSINAKISKISKRGDDVYYVNPANDDVYVTNIQTGESRLFLSNTDSLPYSQPKGSLLIDNNLVYKLDYGDAVQDEFVVRCYDAAPVSAVEISLAEIIESEVIKSSLLKVDDIDTSLMTDSVNGYRVAGGSIRSAMEPLQGAYPFDVRQHGYQLQCVPRGQDSIVEVDYADLIAINDGDVLIGSREMDPQLPVKTVVKYIDATREYAISEQYSDRLNTKAVNRVDREFPLVLSADKAAQVAEVLEFLPWLERVDYQITLPQPYLGIEPSDVVTIPTPDAIYELRITETNEAPDGTVECKAKPNRASLYVSNAVGGEAPGPDGTINWNGKSAAILLDIPVVDETYQNAAGFVSLMFGYSSGWNGGVLFRSPDSGQTWQDIQGFLEQGTIGYAEDALGDSSCTLIDQRSIRVKMYAGIPESISKDLMLSGYNYAAYGLDGRWEIVRFQNADLQPDGNYLISGFMRGERGTEWACGLHQPFDAFVLLSDPDNQFLSMPTEAIGSAFSYRAITNGADIGSGSDIPFTYRGVNLECLSPVYARGSRDGSGNFSGSFTRRSRLSGTWWVTGTVSPVGETVESYEVDVMSGSTVKRTISVTTNAFTYSAADQVADFGSAQSSITFRIYQLSAVVGRGYPLEVTL